MKLGKGVSRGYGIVSIDPGIRGTGVAVWSSDLWKTGANPVAVMNFDPKGYDNWITTCEKYRELLHELMEKFFVKKLYCEFPQYFQSAVGHSATTKGDIHKLACLVGVFAGCAWEYGGTFEPIFVNDWKGQLSKEVVIQRICRKMPKIAELKPTTHSWDAIGIGMYAQGVKFG